MDNIEELIRAQDDVVRNAVFRTELKRQAKTGDADWCILAKAAGYIPPKRRCRWGPALLAAIFGTAILAVIVLGAMALSASRPPAPPAAPEACAYDGPAFDLWAVFIGNQVQADNLYLDRLVRVTGRVARVGKDDGGMPVIALSIPRGDMVFYGFSSDQWSAIAALVPGDEVLIAGRCQGLNAARARVFISPSRLLSTPPPAPPEYPDSWIRPRL